MRNEKFPLHGTDNAARAPIVRPGHNAWRTARAGRLNVLIDGANYFSVLEDVLRQARREVWIVGWDFDPDIRIRPDSAQSPALGAFLLQLVEEQPELTVRVLIWGMGPIYSGKSLKMFRKRRWSSHPRIVLAFDSRHPLRGSHHQKLVVVDDRIAFVGGIDLTAKRWDTSDHVAGDARRTLPSGELYEPVHDMQAALEGEAARLAGDIARRRWLFATDETVPAPDAPSDVLQGILPERAIDQPSSDKNHEADERVENMGSFHASFFPGLPDRNENDACDVPGPGHREDGMGRRLRVMTYNGRRARPRVRKLPPA